MNLGELKSDTDFLCGSTSATYSNVNKVRNMNVAYHNVAVRIWESDGAWNFDDSNNQDSPIATRTIANASASYLVPTTAIRVRQIEVLDNDSNWQKMKPLDYADLTISPEEYFDVAGMPVYYKLEGNEIRLFPAPGTGYVTMASGMRVRLDREVTELVATATTTTPGFATAFHRILSYAASIDFTQDPKQREFLVVQRDRLERGLSRFYAKRANEYKSQIKPAGKRRWRKYT